MRKLSIYLLLAILIAIPAGSAFAQSSMSAYQPVFLEINPAIPGPNSIVSARLESYSVNLNAAKIAWFANGKSIGSGIGQVTASFETGAPGSSTRLIAAITLPEGVIRKEIVIYPQSVVLLWESPSYVPPFFKGKPLFAPQGSAVVTAIPNFKYAGREIPASELIFKWKKDGKLMEGYSGYGRNAISVEGSVIVQPIEISVEVSTGDGVIKATDSVVIPAIEPKVVMYAMSPIYGTLFNKAVNGEYALRSEEFSIAAIPFYFSSSAADALRYSWTMNGTSFDPKPKPNMAVFRTDGGKGGRASVNAAVANDSTLFQSASARTVITW